MLQQTKTPVMKHLVYLLVFAFATSQLQSADYTTAREYVISNLRSLKEPEPQRDSWVKSTSDKLTALRSVLPDSDAAFRTIIQQGINALDEIQQQENDTLILDLFVLASSFADYYRSHKDTHAFSQNIALTAAFKAFEYGESDNPLAYFNSVLQSVLFSYRHYYPLFNEQIPQRILACQIEYLGSTYKRSDADGPDSEVVYAVATSWPSAFAKLKTMPEIARNAVLTTLEEALDTGDVGDAPIEAIARQHLNQAKVFFGIK